MGNYISCSLSSNTGGGKHCKVTKVVVPSGEVREMNEPVKAAEVMLDTPNYFLVNSKYLHMGRRFSALTADQDLEMGSVYVMFPMKRLNSTVTSSDMAALFLTAVATPKAMHKPKRQLSGGKVRVRPADHDDHDQTTINKMYSDKGPKLNLDDIEEFSAPEFMHRLSMSRSKKPLLETITEEAVSVCSR
ncbi:hypothetical protein RchiOBHm_Chr3g0493681 [Rosa chinensis]|uniref:DUF4228 domain protein n=1 Tax=Rosa chinensis TaxID=74649 RepID=A0A2P6RGU5_ROSCH|nr:uncharacterized protein LOC112192374 [Rosa chinensis]PRQ45642.1 hypothetical protein RchiOBHm_Chr3g0493681 [Rosa chinensis]